MSAAAHAVDVLALTPAACGAALWRFGGELRVTVIVKATFALVHDEDARLVAPEPLVARDQHRAHDATSGVAAPGDLAPYLPGVGVMLFGHACSPPGRPVAAASVRLAVFREQALLDKTLHVYGDRESLSAAPRRFERMPLDYEHALGGPGHEENPIGKGAEPGSPLPNVIDPAAPRSPAGFAPISRYWAARRRLLGDTHRKDLELGVAEVPERFDWRYFHAAPPDQQLEDLEGDEWIVLDGMHPTLPRLQSRLPSVRAVARRYPAPGRGEVPTPVDLACDTLLIDADRERCSVTWRGSFPIESADEAARLRIVAGVKIGGSAIAWPAAAELAEPAAAPDDAEEALPLSGAVTLVREDSSTETTHRVRPAALDLTSTLTLAGSDPAAIAGRPLAPFEVAAPGPHAQGAPLPGSPWSFEPAIRIPLEEDLTHTVTLQAPRPRGHRGAPAPASPEPAVTGPAAPVGSEIRSAEREPEAIADVDTDDLPTEPAMKLDILRRAALAGTRDGGDEGGGTE